MKKMPIVKRILAAAMVIAMVATSAHFDWNLFSLKGKAADWSSTSYTVTSGGEIRQVIQRPDSGGTTVQKLDSLQIQVTVQPGQTVYASATVSQGAGVPCYGCSHG